MLFNSVPFLYGFLPVAWLVYWRLKTRNQRYLWLAVTGYVFYAFWNYRFCALMAFSTLVSYGAGLGFLRAEATGDRRLRKLCLVVPVTVDLALLFFFKYFNFALASVGWLSHSLFARELAFPHFDIILPIGISFYTFHTISYIVDGYRGTIRPTRNLAEFACYVSLFSQLVAGPIVRFAQIEEDLEHLDRPRLPSRMDLGWSFFTIGLAKKVLLADSIALIINPALAHPDRLSAATAWLCALGYTFQLYFDFSGYSDMAVGLGHFFNIRIPQNFDSPYRAVSISDFWRRWHISLSSCLRDYLYIPLGGNRAGGGATYRNLLLTFIFGGLWHGANVTFLIWGLYHGVLLCAGRAMKRWRIPELPDPLARAGTFFLVLIGWVVFRADNLAMAGQWLSRLFVPAAGSFGFEGLTSLALLVALGAAITQFARNTFEMDHRWNLPASVGLLLLLAFSIFMLSAGNPSPFLYFQF